METNTVTIVPAAGAGVRMGTGRAKQFLEIEGVPILGLTLKALNAAALLDAIIVVVPEEDVNFCRESIVGPLKLDKVIDVVKGGARRQDSVRIGIEASGGRYGFVMIHDGVRPFVDEEIIKRVLEVAKSSGAASAGLKIKETVKEVDDNRNVVRTCDRSRIWKVQTPQAFIYDDIIEAHRRALRDGWDDATDDSLLVERLGLRVIMVEGSEKNIKVTTPFDLHFAEFLLKNEH